MASGNLPVFIGRRTAAERLGCTMSKVERWIGGADIVIRVGVRDDPAWLLARLDHLIEFQEFPAGVLWTRNEARRRLALSVRVSMRVLNRPVAFLASVMVTRNCRYSQKGNSMKSGSKSQAELSKFKLGVCAAQNAEFTKPIHDTHLRLIWASKRFAFGRNGKTLSSGRSCCDAVCRAYTPILAHLAFVGCTD
jgi:hypothetical protein